MRRLAPSLSVIESNLFDPSPALLRRWLVADPSLPQVTRAALDANPQAQALADALREPQPEPEHVDLPEVAPVPVPAHIQSLIEARVAAADRGQDTRPRPGLILRIDAAYGPSGPVDWDLPEPMAVLLSEPAWHPDIWHGWLMAPETDYATHWDLLLEEGDAPHDPDAAMVQVWNPVFVYCPGAAAALGEISPARLAAVQDLAVDLLTAIPEPAEADPGALVRRTTSGGHLILTGTPLGAEDDPRCRYRELYFAAAGFLRDLAERARAELTVSSPWWQLVLDELREAAGRWQIPLEPVPEPAMGSESEGAAGGGIWRLGDRLDVELIPSANGDALQIHASLRGEEPLGLALEREGEVRQQQRLDPANPSADLFAGIGEGLTLVVRDMSDNLVLEAPLPDPSPWMSDARQDDDTGERR